MHEPAQAPIDILVDTGIFLAAADQDEPRHQDCAALLVRHRGRMATTAPVIAEAGWLIEDRLGPAAETTFLAMATTGAVAVIDLTRSDYQRCIELIDTYADLGLGVVDASIISIAERLRLTTIATLNHRDFRVVRPAHVRALDLVP